jgi:hypothetical protein
LSAPVLARRICKRIILPVMMRAALPRYVPLRWDKQRNQSECSAFTCPEGQHICQGYMLQVHAISRTALRACVREAMNSTNPCPCHLANRAPRLRSLDDVAVATSSFAKKNPYS